MTDLRVDYQLLDQVYASLGRLAGQFEHIQAMQDGYNGAMGSADITAAMTGCAPGSGQRAPPLRLGDVW
jgi:hypothetical protein